MRGKRARAGLVFLLPGSARALHTIGQQGRCGGGVHGWARARGRHTNRVGAVPCWLQGPAPGAVGRGGRTWRAGRRGPRRVGMKWLMGVNDR